MAILYTQAKVSPIGKINPADLRKITRDTIVFFAAPSLMYLAQIQGILAKNSILLWNDFIPNQVTIGAIEGWAIGIAINFFLKFNDGSK